MANHTTNYNLIKPLGTENYDVENDNSNMDIIDTQLKANADNITTKANDSDLTDLAGEGRTTETVKGNADAIANLTEDFDEHKAENETEFSSLNTRINNLNINDIEARNEIMDIKLKLKEQSAIDFINKTGVGFYDTFADNSNIDTANTTATYNSTNKNVEFAGQQELKMKDETFDTFNNLELSLYPEKVNRATIKEDVNDSTTVITGVTDKTLTAGDKLFMNNVLNEVLNATENSITNTVTDATVVASAYDTSGNGGRKLVRLSNGWLVAGTMNGITRIDFFISKDSGLTWELFGYLYNDGVSFNAFSIVSVNTKIYIIVGGNSGNNIYFYTVETTTFTLGSNIFAIAQVLIDTNQSAISGCSLVINETETELHACWSSRNPTYPYSFNIRYCKGTINEDGSVTWGSVQQLSVNNTTGQDNKNPCIIVLSNGLPRIVNEFTTGSSDYRIICRVFDGTTWTAPSVYGSGTLAYAQSFPCAIFVPQSINGLANGRIWVTWHGFDSTDTTYENIRISYSDDGGLTWSPTQKLTTGNSYKNYYASITADKHNSIYIIFIGTESDSGGYLRLKQAKYNGVTWILSTLTTNNTGQKYYPSTLFDLSFGLDFSEPLFIYQDYLNSKVGFYGTWTVGEGYTLTMQNPVTLTDGDKVPIVDFEVQQDNQVLELDDIDTEKFVFKGSNLNTDNASIKVLGKDNKLNAIAYAVA